MRRFLIALLVLLLVACGEDQGSGPARDADPADLPDLIGTYVVNGVDPLGTDYGGHLTVTQGEGLNRYHLQWIITGSIQEGTAHVEGNRLLVEWETVQGLDVDAHGTAEYTITEAGELYGTRNVVGVDATGTEEAFPNE